MYNQSFGRSFGNSTSSYSASPIGVPVVSQVASQTTSQAASQTTSQAASQAASLGSYQAFQTRGRQQTFQPSGFVPSQYEQNQQYKNQFRPQSGISSNQSGFYSQSNIQSQPINQSFSSFQSQAGAQPSYGYHPQQSSYLSNSAGSHHVQPAILPQINAQAQPFAQQPQQPYGAIPSQSFQPTASYMSPATQQAYRSGGSSSQNYSAFNRF